MAEMNISRFMAQNIRNAVRRGPNPEQVAWLKAHPATAMVTGEEHLLSAKEKQQVMQDIYQPNTERMEHNV